MGVGARYYRCKKDTTHDDIADVFIERGFTILDCSPLKGSLDFVAANGEKVYFVECKSKYGKLSSDEKKFHEYFKAPIYVLFCARDAENLLDLNIYNQDN